MPIYMCIYVYTHISLISLCLWYAYVYAHAFNWDGGAKTKQQKSARETRPETCQLAHVRRSWRSIVQKGRAQGWSRNMKGISDKIGDRIVKTRDWSKNRANHSQNWFQERSTGTGFPAIWGVTVLSLKPIQSNKEGGESNASILVWFAMLLGSVLVLEVQKVTTHDMDSIWHS